MSADWIEVCIDCYYWVEYGKPTDGFDAATMPEPMGLYRDSYIRDSDDYYLSTGNAEARFSWRDCDGCASTLGGDRYEVAVIPSWR